MDFVKYFPELTENQIAQYEALEDLYSEWNAKINVISRKDIENLYVHHVQHSLAISKFVEDVLGGWKESTRIVDVGCGGGFPGIPLAIRYPECHFLLVDRIGKKVRVAQEVANAIGLTNVEFKHAGIEEVKEVFDYSVSRAVMNLPDLYKLVKRVTEKGLLSLKGGNLTSEMSYPIVKKNSVIKDISDYFAEDFFETKKIVYTVITNKK